MEKLLRKPGVCEAPEHVASQLSPLAATMKPLPRLGAAVTPVNQKADVDPQVQTADVDLQDSEGCARHRLTKTRRMHRQSLTTKVGEGPE